MSWILSLNRLYEKCVDQVGVEAADGTMLLPIYHTTQQANIEAVIDSDGNWCEGRSRVLTDKTEMTTVIPCTEESAGRTSGPVPHPLFDSLQYIAGDYMDFGGDSKKFRYEEYIANLEKWCKFPGTPKKLKAIYTYLKKGTLIKDLVHDGILILDSKNKLISKWNGDSKDKPQIFNSLSDETKAFVRFRVETADGSFVADTRAWMDREIWDHYIKYQNSLDVKKDYCYITGELGAVSVQSPKKIRYAGDGAKLISGNDSTNYTYRGRFETADQALSVSRVANEQAHNALKWIIAEQGSQSIDGQVVVAWNTENVTTPPVVCDTDDLMQAINDLDADSPYDTAEDYSKRLGKAISGYGSKVKANSQTAIIGLDAATPGRLSIFYYQELPEKQMIDNLEYWHTTCAWQHSYKNRIEGTDEKGKPKYKRVCYYGAPSPKDIAEAAFGSGVSDKLKKATVERILPCISQRAKLPTDIMRYTVNRAQKPNCMERWEFEKTLSIACALIRKVRYDKGEVWKMGVDKNCKDRSYLFGRLLAYAENVESYAMYASGGENRMTNAERLMNRFSQKPAATWDILNKQLVSYYKRLMAVKPNMAYFMKNGINEILDMLGKENFTNEKLSEIYLIGYASQMLSFKAESNKENGEEKNNVEIGK